MQSGHGDWDSGNGSGNTNEENSIHNALHLAVGNICREEEKAERKNSSAASNTPRMSREAIETLTQMTYHYATKCLAKDLILFRKHAGRKTISVDDVRLVARKNPRGLMDSLDGFLEGVCEPKDGFNSTTVRREKKRGNHNSTKKASKKRPLKGISGGSATSTRLYDADDSSSDEDDGLQPISNFGVNRNRDDQNSSKKRSDSFSDNDLGIDLQVEDSSSSSSDGGNGIGSDGSMQVTLKGRPRQDSTKSAMENQDSGSENNSSDEELNLASKASKKRIEKMKNIQRAIELSDDSDSD